MERHTGGANGENDTVQGMQCGLGLGEVAPSPPLISCAGPGWAGLSCACPAVPYCRFVPAPWRNLEKRAPRAFVGARRLGRGGWKSKVGSRACQRRQDSQDSGPAESLPKILMQAGLQKNQKRRGKNGLRQQTTCSTCSLRWGPGASSRKLEQPARNSENQQQQRQRLTSARLSSCARPASAPIKPHHGRITAAYYAFPASPSFRRVYYQRTW